MTGNHLKYVRFLIAAISCLLILTGTLTGIAQFSQHPVPAQGVGVEPDLPEPTNPAGAMPHKQKKQLLKNKLENMRKDAAEMTKLAGSIQEDLEKTTENELPLRVVTKAEEVEKLAKRIRNSAKGF